MNSKTFKRVIVVLLVTAIAVALPSSFAKYIGQESYTMTVKNKLSFFYNTSSAMTGGKVLLPYAGRYAIIVKGGDGSNGNSWNGTTDSGYSIQGGIGGTVVGVYVTTAANQYVYVAPGGAGGRPYKNSENYGQPGSAGVNTTLSKFNGGSGDNVSGDTFLNLGSTFSKAPSSGGGGAASLVYKCDSNGNYSSQDLLFVAGGGGAAANWNEDYKDGVWFVVTTIHTYACGTGGSASGNLADYPNSDSHKFTKIENGAFVLNNKIFNGNNGTGSSGALGKGGSTTPGDGGSVSRAVLLVPGASAGDGSSFDNNGTGGNGKYYGGGGGAGYCGGGGGAGTSIDVAAGGGGAGSSFISYIITQESVDYNDIISKASNSKTCYNGTPIPTQYPLNNNTAEGNGYIIIKYLGSGGAPGTKSVKTTTDVMNDIVTICSPYKGKTIDNDDTSDAIYKAIMDNDLASQILSGRAWRITIDKDGNVGIAFTTGKSTSIENGTKFWGYANGNWLTGNAYRKSLFSSWGYPDSWTASSEAFKMT